MATHRSSSLQQFVACAASGKRVAIDLKRPELSGPADVASTTPSCKSTGKRKAEAADAPKRKCSAAATKKPLSDTPFAYRSIDILRVWKRQGITALAKL